MPAKVSPHPIVRDCWRFTVRTLSRSSRRKATGVVILDVILPAKTALHIVGNRGKRSIALNLKQEEGLSVLHRLAENPMFLLKVFVQASQSGSASGMKLYGLSAMMFCTYRSADLDRLASIEIARRPIRFCRLSVRCRSTAARMVSRTGLECWLSIRRPHCTSFRRFRRRYSAGATVPAARDAVRFDADDSVISGSKDCGTPDGRRAAGGNEPACGRLSDDGWLACFHFGQERALCAPHEGDWSAGTGD